MMWGCGAAVRRSKAGHLKSHVLRKHAENQSSFALKYFSLCVKYFFRFRFEALITVLYPTKKSAPVEYCLFKHFHTGTRSPGGAAYIVFVPDRTAAGANI